MFKDGKKIHKTARVNDNLKDLSNAKALVDETRS